MENKSVLTSNRRFYGNLAVYSPDNHFMFYANEHRLKFYFKNNLIKKIGEDKFQLTFTPNGLGYSGPDRFNNPEYLLPRENKCVVSGDEDNLTKHHIVPTFFRQHFPIEHKSSYFLIVLLRRDIHSEYTIEEHKFYNFLAEKYGVRPPSEFAKNLYARGIRIANVLLKHGHFIPEDKKINMKLEFTHNTGMEATHENLVTYSKLQVKTSIKHNKTIDNDFGLAIASKITDYEEFEQLWVNHFVEYAKPKFLPEDLKMKYNLENKC